MSQFGFSEEVTMNAGCEGGYMDTTFKFIQEHGGMPESTAAYTGVEGECKHDASNATKSTSWAQLPVDPVEIAKALENGPLSVSVAVGSSFENYSGGIVKVEDNPTCSEYLNHALTIVAYIPDGQTEGRRRLQADPETTDGYWVEECRWNTEEELEMQYCENPDEYLWEENYCCKDVFVPYDETDTTEEANWWDDWWFDEEEADWIDYDDEVDPDEEPTDPVDPVDPEEPTDPVDPVDPEEPTDPVDPVEPEEPEEPVEPTPTPSNDMTSGSGYFILKNSWGTGWGDQGYIKIRISNGDGWCGINKETYKVLYSL